MSATKHVFHTKSDSRFLIAPIGRPFGFLGDGKCTISIYNYHLRESVSQEKKRRKFGLFGRKKDKGGDANAFEGGFLLKKFETESDFAKFEDSILEKQTTCIYDNFRKNRNRDLFTDDFDGYLNDFSESGDAFGYLANNDFYRDDEQIDTDNSLLLDTNSFSESVIPDLDVAEDGIYLSMRSMSNWEIKRKDKDGRENTSAPRIKHSFQTGEEGLYYLLYQVCSSGETSLFAEVRSTFSVDLEFANYDAFGNVSFLTAGDMPLPRIFFFFSISYALMLYVWLLIMKGESIFKEERKRSTGKKVNVDVRAIHHLMTALLFLKVCTVFFEAVRLHYIRVSGVANIFSFVYYTLTFLRGIMLFTVILLLGSGWSLVKPFLHSREKKVILFILILQFINNIALLVIVNDEEGERQYEDWKAVLNFVDILCCCVVLFPIVWQVSSLENEAESEENTRALEKLKLFRSFYILVVSYIYFTRVVVYLVTTVLSFRHTWMGDFLTELGTLTFYIVVGYKFRPVDDNISLKSDVPENENDEVELLVQDITNIDVSLEMSSQKKTKD